MRRLAFELAAMALIVVLAAVSVVATMGSARSGDLVFCRMVDGGVVVGATTDCDGSNFDVTDPLELEIVSGRAHNLADARGAVGG